jgi:hypothetical protein
MTTGTTPTTGTTTSPPTREVRRFELTLTILGAVSSAVVTGLLAAEDASTTTKLIGMALGAALPPFVGAVGPGQPVRVGVAVLLTGVAVVIAYGGGQVFAKVSDGEPPLPTPNQIVTNLSGGGGGGGGGAEVTTDDDVEDRAGNLGIRVEPGSIGCDEEDGCNPVTVTSIGTALLRITSLEFEGEGASFLTATGCKNAVLAPGEACAITLEFSAESAPRSATTQLVIHQNLPEFPTLVPVEAEGVLTVSPNIALGQPVCDRSGLFPDPNGGVSGELSIEAPLSATGLADVSSVEAAVYIDGELIWTEDVDPNAGSVSLSPAYGGPVPGEVLVRIDPGDVVQESGQDDNDAAC